MFEASTIFPRSSVGAEKFVTKVAVAVLDVHKIESQFPGQAGSAMEVFDDRSNFAVAKNGIVRREFEAAIKNRVVIEDSRLAALMRIGTAEATRMSQLQPKKQPLVGSRDAPMLLDEHAAQTPDGCRCLLVQQQLIGIGSPVVRHCDCFPSPYQLAAAATKPLPAAEGVFGRAPLGRPIPALHGLNGDSVADGKSPFDQGPL